LCLSSIRPEPANIPEADERIRIKEMAIETDIFLMAPLLRNPNQYRDEIDLFYVTTQADRLKVEG